MSGSAAATHMKGWGKMSVVNMIIKPKGQPFTKSLFWLFPKLIIGLFLAALGTVMMIHANIGLFPWGILNAGLVNVTGISFGVWSQIIGLFIIVMMTLFKFYPGIGTIFDMFFVGFFIDLLELMAVVPTPSGLVSQVGFSMAGLFVLSYGVSLYMSCGLGAGPRDGLMLMLMKLTSKSAGVVKTAIEITVTLLGLALGGPFGFGTILLALTGGKVMALVFKWTGFDAHAVEQKNVVQFWRDHVAPRRVASQSTFSEGLSDKVV
ncbi:hypothetical protein [Anoxynatronum sibiricum]